MCYSGTCSHELWPSGECGKRRWQKCPEDMDEAEYQDAQDKVEEYGDYLYEQQRERKWGLE